ncbi:MAG TPA: hypothetical protein VF195_02150 [Actinomycetota bacterium]
MDERNPSERPDASADAPDQYRPTDRLVARLAELRSPLEVLAPQDQDKGREAIERIRQAQERIEALEEMLGKARDLEHELTAKAVRDRGQIFRYEAEISELSAISARVSTAEEARRQAEAVAAKSERALALAAAQVEAQSAEIVQLRSRNTELEADLVAVTEKLAAAAVARAEAIRLKAERDEARERAQVERGLAAQDRRRAAEAGLRAAELQHQLREAERRMVQVSNTTNRESVAVPEDAVGEEVAEIPPPWIELQRASSEAASVGPHTAAVPDVVEAASEQDEEPMVVKVGDAEPDVAERDEVAAVDEPSGAAAPTTPSGPVATPRSGSSAAEPGSALPAAKMPAPPKPWADRASAASTAAPWEAITAKGTEGITSTGEGVVDEPRVTESDDASADARDVEGIPPTTDVIDLTSVDQTSIDDLDEDEGDEDAGADSGSTSGGGWAAPNEKIWQLLRGRRRD